MCLFESIEKKNVEVALKIQFQCTQVQVKGLHLMLSCVACYVVSKMYLFALSIFAKSISLSYDSALKLKQRITYKCKQYSIHHLESGSIVNYMVLP